MRTKSKDNNNIRTERIKSVVRSGFIPIEYHRETTYVNRTTNPLQFQVKNSLSNKSEREPLNNKSTLRNLLLQPRTTTTQTTTRNKSKLSSQYIYN